MKRDVSGFSTFAIEFDRVWFSSWIEASGELAAALGPLDAAGNWRSSG